MKFKEKLEKLQILQKLIDTGKTGTPKELSRRLHVSDRTARRLIEYLRSEDPTIIFNRKIQSYQSYYKVSKRK